MSKYIKLEDAIHNINLEVTGRKEYTGDMKANLFFALDELPTIEVSEDAISKAYLEQEIENHLLSIENLRTEKDEWWNKAFEVMVEIIENAPSVIPKPKEGEWIKVSGYVTPGGDPVWECSECGKGRHVYGIEASSYQRDVSNQQWVACPNCGAKMKGAEE